MPLKSRISNLLNNMIFSAGFWVFLLLLIAIFSLYMPAKISVSSPVSDKKYPICSVSTDSKSISFTFECNSDTDNITQILEILSQHKLKSTFFVNESFVTEKTDCLNLIASQNHDIGNGVDSFTRLSDLNSTECEYKITNLHYIVQDITGINMNLLRTPYGDYSNMVISVANNIDYKIINWNVDSNDWKAYSDDEIISNIVNNPALSNGAIIKFHTGAEFTPTCLDKLITILQEDGYSIIPLSELVYTDDYSVNKDGVQLKQ